MISEFVIEHFNRVVLFVERLGTRDIEALSVIAQSKLISGINESFHYGVINCVKSVTFGTKDYLQVSSVKVNVQTLLLTSHFNDEEAEEVKVKNRHILSFLSFLGKSRSYVSLSLGSVWRVR